ncbi:TldE protein, part of TldE/TldD proteolytic complex [hydrothermal vent metagenome]|uniref:TldE protein, part of TldE/TldD proteolytic complex n=1 Tax=hydrothermal vent metagenome TaxID=652676 RepID=A0A3B0ZSW3_9ZZZZ
MSRDIIKAQASLESVAAQVLELAKAQGASAAEAALSEESGLSVNVRLGDVETIEFNKDKGLGITVYFGQRKGTASTADFSTGALEDAVRAACSIATFTAEDPYAGLADAERMATEIPDLDLYYPWDVSPETAIELATECEDAARGYDERISNSEGASLSSHGGTRIYANSHGFMGGYSTSRHSMSCSVIVEDDNGMQRDYWYSVARDRHDLEAATAIGEKTAARTLQRLGGRRIDTCKVPVLFSADVAGSLVSHMISGVRGGSLYRKSSFLLDKLGEQIFPEFVHIHERPHMKKVLGSAPYDSEGVATYARDLVRDGVLQGYVLDSYSARKLKMESTGNSGGVHNVLIEPGELDQQALLREMGTGLLVTELLGMGVNIVTGDYSRGAAGFWVENGVIAYPVDEITIAGKLGDMFMQLQAVGSDTDHRGNIKCGSLLIGAMTVAGT